MQPDSTRLTTAAGVAMPRIIYGTAWKKERTKDLVAAALASGFRGVDTAAQPRHYEEGLVGEALSDAQRGGLRRSDLFVQTKFTPVDGQDPANVPYDPNAPLEEQIVQSVSASLAKLKTAYLDSLLLHSPLDSHARTMRAWRTLEKLCDEGLVLQLGISNCYNLDVLRSLSVDSRIKPAVVQNRFYPHTGYDARLRAWCDQQGVIYQSFWTLTANPHILVSDAVRRIAKTHGRTEAQIFFRFLTQLGIVPLTGTTSAAHMREDLDIFSFALDAEEMAEINVLLGRAPA